MSNLLKDKAYVALTNNNLGSYWTSSGPYDELFYYIGANVDQVKDDVALLVTDIPVPAKVREYAATSMELKTMIEILQFVHNVEVLREKLQDC